jgi:hypothetical protein
MCPYLREGRFRRYCAAYLGDVMEPSRYEQEYFCRTCAHAACVWYISKRGRCVDCGELFPSLAEGLVGDPEVPEFHLLLN